jgi:FixJ family two-component response regulator
MERRLKRAGYEVATYASAEHLLDRLPSDSVPGCILLDVRIPGLSGPELQERLSELGSTLPIIFLTGYPDVRTTVRTVKAGAEDFLTKPVSSDELLQAVERAIAHHQATRGLKSKLDTVRAHIAALTPRERQVFELVIRGQHQQADRPRAGRHRTHDQGPSPQDDGENAGPLRGGTCIPCRAGRRYVGQRTFSVGYLSSSPVPLSSNGPIGNSL